TSQAIAAAEDRVPQEAGQVLFSRNEKLVDASVRGGPINDSTWRLLKAEDRAFRATVGGPWRSILGLGGAVLLLTCLMGAYAYRFQPRVVVNHARAASIAVLMLAALLVSQLTAVGTGEMYLFAVAPT